MTTLMHDIACSDIRISELKLKRIKLYKKRLLETKPLCFRKKKLLAWQSKLDELTKEEKKVEVELQRAYIDLEKFYN